MKSHSPSQKIEALLAHEPHVWMGIVNVTPDSFSDGGMWLSPKVALQRGRELVAAGAHILDIGGLSTRPGSDTIPPAEELARVLPVARLIRQHLPHTLLSLDTFRASVAQALASEGVVDVVNDVMAGLNREELPLTTLAVAARWDLGFVAMHMQGEPKSMQENPHYAHCLEEVTHFLSNRAQAAQQAGVRWIAIDPGIGFGKSFAHNQELLESSAIEHLSSLGFPLLIGLSRKRFLMQRFPDDNLVEPTSRDRRTKELEAHCLQHGARIIRSHRMPPEVTP